jgi:hypothetical protein
MRGGVCLLQLLLVLASAVIFWSNSLGARPYFTFSDSRLSQPGEPGPHIYIPQEQGGPVTPLDTDFRYYVLCLHCTGYHVFIRGNALIPVFVAARRFNNSLSILVDSVTRGNAFS